MIKKQLLLIFICMIFAIFTSGCVRVEQTINIDKMGSYDHSFLILMDSDVAEMMDNLNNDKSIQSVLHEKIMDLGFETVSDINGADEIGSVGIAKGSLNNLNLSNFNSNALAIVDKSKNYIVYKKFDITATFEPYLIDNLQMDNGNSLINDYKLIINLPVNAISNADSITSDGRTHTWKIKPNSKNIISIKFEMLNIINTIICTIIFFVVLIIIFLFKRKNSYKQKNSNLKKCIVCDKQIKNIAKKCKYCKSWQNSDFNESKDQ